MRVLVTGATGLLGSEIVKRCHKQNIHVNYLTTSKSKLLQEKNHTGFYWNPKSKYIDENCFKGVDVIIHLAGASISKRWTSTYKKEILESRLVSTKLLVDALKKGAHTVKQVVSASAIGFYPDSIHDYYSELHGTASNSFLGKVVKAWEDVVDEFSELNILVTKIRIGLVLSNQGGALKEMIKPIEFGVGAVFGSGKQWQSWVHISDLSELFLFVIKNELGGVYNGVAPSPVTNQALIKTIASVINKPLVLPNIPKFVMKLILGEMHIILFESQKVNSKKIEDLGFQFQFNALEFALIDLLKAKKNTE